MTYDEAIETLMAMAKVQDGYAKRTDDTGLQMIYKANAKAQRQVADFVVALKNDLDFWRGREALAARLSSAAHDVITERQRQILVEGWTSEHDDCHSAGELSRAAATYAWAAQTGVVARGDGVPTTWPWAPEWWKPSDTRRDLVKAGALILAAIEQIDRAVADAADGVEQVKREVG